MAKILVLSAIDGVIKTTPYVQKEYKELLPTDEAQSLGAGWFSVKLYANPLTSFVLDSNATIDFYNRARNVNVDLYIDFSSELVEKLKLLADNPDVDFRWLSQWDENSLKLNEAVGLEGIPYVPVSYPIYGTTPKMDSIQKLFDGDKSLPTNVIWVDFNASRETLNHAPIKVNTDAYHSQYGLDRFLTINPDVTFGLSRSEFKLIENFIARY